MRIGTITVGKGNKSFIVAEVSGNHNGDIRRAKRIIEAAAKAGADAVKFQTYTPDTMTIDSERPEFVVSNHKEWGGKTLYKLYQEAYTPWEWHKELFEHARKLGLVAFSTPFDETAVDFLEKLKVPLYKVASFEVVDIPLLKKIGKTKKPVIMSRGMATLEELATAVKTLRAAGTKDIVLLQCVSSYPAKPEEMHLSNIPDLKKRFKVEVGLSDHTMENDVAVASVALGAVALEKHLTLRRSDGGPDSAFSLEPEEFKRLVDSVRLTEQAIGKPSYVRTKNEQGMSKYRRSLFVVQDIKKGENFTAQNVRSIRPGNGMEPKFYDKILGKKAVKDIKRATPLNWNLVAKK